MALSSRKDNARIWYPVNWNVLAQEIYCPMYKERGRESPE